MDNVLIIGGNGYFGSVLADYLRENNIKCDVSDINYFKKCNLFKKKENKIHQSCASKLKDKYLKDYNIIIALAGYSNNPIFKKNEKIFHDKEYKYLTNIAKISKKMNIKYIFASSCSLYGASSTNKTCNEKSKLNPITHYSKNKRKIEKFLIKISNKKFKPIILRFATLYGLSQKMRFDIVINMFCGSALSLKKIELNSDGKVNRPFLEILDACKAIYKVIKNNDIYNQQIFNVGSNTDNYKIINIAKIIQKKIPNLKIVFLKKKKKLISDDIIKNNKDKRNYKVNFDKFSKIFKFKPNYTIEKGINKLILDLKKLKIDKKTFNSVKFYRLQYLQKNYEKLN